MHPPNPTRRLRALLALSLLSGLAVAVLFAALQPSTASAQTSCADGSHADGTDPEVLVGTMATALPRLCLRKAVEVQNLGPNPIYCAVKLLGTSTATMARVGKSRRIDAGASWSLDADDRRAIYCITTVAQVTGAATIVTEVR